MKRLPAIFLSLLIIGMTAVSCHEDDLLPDPQDVEFLHSNHGIPKVEIWTADGQGITDKTTWKDATFLLHGNGLFPDVDTLSITLKGRGNSTFRYPKKPFNIQFSEKQPLLGMKKSRKWVFLANYRDPTLLRNAITLRLGSLCSNLEWTPSGEFVDLFLNGKYEGNYFVTEKINVNKQHVAIDELTADDTDGDALTGGYLLELDKRLNSRNHFRTNIFNVPVNIASPGDEVCQPQQIAYIQSYLEEMEHLLSLHEYGKVYDKYLDLPSFVDYYIVQTLSGNNDFKAPLSVYAYKKRGGKLYAGPLWDFDFSTYYSARVKMRREATWYRALFDDATFVSQLKTRWQELRPILEDDIFRYMEERRDYILLSAMSNFLAYPFDMSVNKGIIQDTGFLPSYKMMRKNLSERFQNLTTQIEEL